MDNMDTDEYDYFCSSPPCYEDLKAFGVQLNKPETYKTGVLDLIVPKLRPRLGTVTFTFTGCRRNNSQILPKFYYLTQCFFENDYYLRDVKYYKKKDGYDGYSHTIGHIYTFQKRGTKGRYNLRRDELYNTYGHDIWGPFLREQKIAGEVVGLPIEVPERCILNFTDPGHVVYDPFGGIGTTGLAADDHGRGYLMYEIRPEIHAEGVRLFDEKHNDVTEILF